jgi:steroid 5-alpha reductase family enzyme
MEFWTGYALAGLVVLAYVTLLWLVSLALTDASIVDIFWGLGFVLANWVYLLLNPVDIGARRWLLAMLVTLWGLRLSVHILFRNWGKGEDFRYRKWRDENGAKWWWKSFFQVFLLQGILLWIISIPLLAVHFSSQAQNLTILDGLGIAFWVVGFFFEAVGDWQLVRFKKDPANKGKVFNQGVWRYTRHPNYFGDAAQWWGYFLIAVAAGGWWTVYSPFLMTYLLVRVSGVALLEKSMVGKRPGYKEYIETTSAFVPWFPRKRN